MSTKPVLDRFPVFRIVNFSSHRHPHFRCITADGKIFHRVADVAAFYHTFGYTQETAFAGVAPDEYIWDWFTRSGSPQSRDCLQRLIVHYLRQHSPEFREHYGDDCESLRGACTADTIADGKFCKACFMHPAHLA